MSDTIKFHFGGSGERVLMDIPGEGKVLCRGTSVPTDNTAGYAKGCLFQKTNGGVGTTLYVNEGTNLLCDFNTVT